MNGRNLPRRPPAPIEAPCLERHFTAVWNILWNQFQLPTGFASVTVGNAREFFVRDFLATHIPPCLKIGTGHILIGNDAEKATGQTDAIVYRDDALALPLGASSLFFADDVVASIEVKSTLECKGFTRQIAENFALLPAPQPLKVVFALRLQNNSQRRRDIADWASKNSLMNRSYRTW